MAAMLAVSFPLAAVTPEALPPGAVVVEGKRLEQATVAAPALAARWHDLLGRAGGDALVVALAVDEATTPVAEYELALSLLLRRLSAAAGSDAALPVFQHLAGRPVRAWQPHEESSRWLQPLADPGALAQDALVLRAQAAARAEWARRLDRDPVVAAQAAAKAGGDAPRRLAEALSAAPDALVEPLADAVRSGEAELPADVLHVLALRRPSLAAYRAAVARLPQAAALGLLASAPTQLPGGEALALLEEAMHEPALASGAVLALGDLAATDESAQARLQSLLGDPALGASAAASLARMPAVDRVARIERAAAAAASPKALLDAALALQLEGSAEAGAALRRVVADPRLPDTARRELQQ